MNPCPSSPTDQLSRWGRRSALRSCQTPKWTPQMALTKVHRKDQTQRPQDPWRTRWITEQRASLRDLSKGRTQTTPHRYLPQCSIFKSRAIRLTEKAQNRWQKDESSFPDPSPKLRVTPLTYPRSRFMTYLLTRKSPQWSLRSSSSKDKECLQWTTHQLSTNPLKELTT